MGDGDGDGWGVFGSRPSSAASMYPDSPTDELNGFSYTPKEVNRTFTKPNKYNPRGKAPSPEPWRGGGNSGRSSASPTPHGQNYFLSKSKKKTNDAVFSDQMHNGSGDWETKGSAQKTYTRPQSPNARKTRPQTPQSPVPRNESPAPKTRNYYGHVWNKRNDSYVDDLLFGSKPDEPDFKAPWDKNKQPKYVFDATDYKALEIKKQLQQNAAKNSKKTNKGPTKTDSERVDHIERALRSQLAVQGEKPQPKSRSGASTPGRPSTPKKAPKFKDSYVDELLFGPKPQEPDFPAPWEDNKKRTIHAFDGTNGSVTINHENGSFVESRSGSRSGSRAGSRRGSTGDVKTLRPAWR